MPKIKEDILYILGEKISPGTSKEVNFNVANLHTSSPVNIPVIIQRSKKPGPTVLFTAGIHGDEVNGIEIIRQIISKKVNKPKIGTIICVPVINIFGFINLKREFPDGRDLNRVFPGSPTGSLAGRVAYKLMEEIIPHVDLIIDFHTGGSGRFNAPQIRYSKDTKELNDLSMIFGAPFVLFSKNVPKSFRTSCYNLGKTMLLFEGGKSFHIDENITFYGIEGSKRILHHLGMLNPKIAVSAPKEETIFISESKWIRAHTSGMFRASVAIETLVKRGDVLGYITDPYGKINKPVKSTNSGYIINVNEFPIVYQGDALFHITTKLKR